MKNLKKYFKGLTKEAILAPLFKLLEALLDLIIPLIVARIIDIGIKNNDTKFIILNVALMIGLGLVGYIFSVFGQFFAAKAAVGVSTKIRSNLFKKIQSLSFTQIDNIGTNKLITLITNDVNQVQNGINLTLRLFLRSPFVVFGAAIMAIVVYPKSGIIFGITIVVLSIIIFGIMALTTPKNKKVQENTDVLLGKTMENLTGVRVIRSLGIEEDEKESFKSSAKSLEKSQNRVSNISNFLNPLTFVIINLAIIVILIFGKDLVYDSIVTQGEVIALVNYMSQILVELVKLANLIVTMSKSVACADRISSLENLDTSIKVLEALNTDKPYISFNNVSFKYDKASENSLTNISFNVNKGDSVGIIGGTGSGKTTLCNLITRFYDPTAGEIFIDGKNILSYTSEELNKLTSVVLQKSALFKGTIYDNIKWGNNNLTEDEACRYLTLAAGNDILKAKRAGILEVVEQGGRNYSGGQRQRISIARALAKNAPILILDDSTSALDYKTDSTLRKNINSLDPKPTLFIVSQRTSSIKNCDLIIVLDEGKIVGLGKHEDLLKTCPIYYEIHNLKPQEGGNK